MKYDIEIEVTGISLVAIDANSIEEAENIALKNCIFSDMDMYENVRVVSCEEVVDE